MKTVNSVCLFLYPKTLAANQKEFSRFVNNYTVGIANSSNEVDKLKNASFFIISRVAFWEIFSLKASGKLFID